MCLPLCRETAWQSRSTLTVHWDTMWSMWPQLLSCAARPCARRTANVFVRAWTLGPTCTSTRASSTSASTTASEDHASTSAATSTTTTSWTWSTSSPVSVTRAGRASTVRCPRKQSLSRPTRETASWENYCCSCPFTSPVCLSSCSWVCVSLLSVCCCKAQGGWDFGLDLLNKKTRK